MKLTPTLVPGEQREGALGIELGEAVRQHRRAVVPGREQRVVEAGDPRPFRRRPHHLVAAAASGSSHCSTGGIEPSIMRCACSAPLGWPVVPEV